MIIIGSFTDKQGNKLTSGSRPLVLVGPAIRPQSEYRSTALPARRRIDLGIVFLTEFDTV